MFNEEDYDMLCYFYFEKGDITRWSSWEEKKPFLKETNRALYDAFERLESAQRTVHALMKVTRSIGQELE